MKRSPTAKIKHAFGNVLAAFVPYKPWRYKVRGYFNRDELGDLRREIRGLRFYIKYDGKLKVMTDLETIKAMQKGFSVSRYGDGEFSSAFGIGSDFAKSDKRLSERLKQILKKPVKNHLACILSQDLIFNGDSPSYWVRWFGDYGEDIIPLLDFSIKYGNSFVSRDISLKTLPEYRKIWAGKNVCFVVSSQGRFVRDPRLFDNIAQSATIDIPAANAWAEYDKILVDCLKFGKAHKDWIFFLAGGQMATVLAYDLAAQGFQALDLGHLPNCLAFNSGEAPKPECLPIKRSK